MIEGLFLLTAIAGVVELVKRAFDNDWRAAVTIVAAALVGGLAGFFGIEGLTIATGITGGLSASGLVTVASRVG